MFRTAKLSFSVEAKSLDNSCFFLCLKYCSFLHNNENADVAFSKVEKITNEISNIAAVSVLASPISLEILSHVVF